MHSNANIIPMTAKEATHLSARFAIRDCLAEACDVPTRGELIALGLVSAEEATR